MPKCPYNETVECDKDFQQAELTRQLNIALQSGAFWFGQNKNNNGCSAKTQFCTRLNAAIRQAQHQK